ncbi:energy transducer TonB [uncultured Algoriphagus sp.]|uniref:energy transducer TonB n=1 Tax=uncultured Algoriphagus sp. TaxID=417365 RepID=UPI0030ED4DB6|tara:strand:- start:17910 stop:18335 length:426 start_codon:yes stop_codon:yes gene_type:complete
MKLSTQFPTWKAVPFLLLALIFTTCFSISDASAQTESEEVFLEVDKMPTPPGGIDGWTSYLAENMKYPKAAKDANVQGTVMATFVVLENGELSNPEILRGIGKGCDEEVLRLVKASAKWTPGEKDGKIVKTQMRLPVKFQL